MSIFSRNSARGLCSHIPLDSEQGCGPIPALALVPAKCVIITAFPVSRWVSEVGLGLDPEEGRRDSRGLGRGLLGRRGHRL